MVQTLHVVQSSSAPPPLYVHIHPQQHHFIPCLRALTLFAPRPSASPSISPAFTSVVLHPSFTELINARTSIMNSAFGWHEFLPENRFYASKRGGYQAGTWSKRHRFARLVHLKAKVATLLPLSSLHIFYAKPNDRVCQCSWLTVNWCRSTRWQLFRRRMHSKRRWAMVSSLQKNRSSYSLSFLLFLLSRAVRTHLLEIR